MKKLFFGLLAFSATLVCFVSCSKCSHDSEKSVEDSTVTKLINADKEYMEGVAKDYSYFESCFTFAETVDTLDEPSIVYVSDIFQTVNKETNQPTVYISEHFLDKGDSTKWDVKEGSFWLEDLNLREFKVELTVEEAFIKLQEANIVKPKTKYCVLRAQLGPKRVNAQYIFGNEATGMVYVDAVTGDVTDKNPVFEGFTETPQDTTVVSE